MPEKEQTILDYYERINKVLVFVNKNLHEKLELDRLARLSHFSKHHFHRIMRAHLGESLGSHILRLRLEAAAGFLEFSEAA